MFGGFDSTECSNPESFVSLLEGLFSQYAPFARLLSRFWRVYFRNTLHSRDYSLAFGGFIFAIRSICETTLSRLEGVGLRFAPIVR